MTTAPAALRAASPNLVFPILVGGAVAGTLDMISAYVSFGRNMPLGIAAGLLGQAARHGGAGPYMLGLCIHFFIAFAAAAVYCLSSRRLPFLKEHFFVCGLFYGIGLYCVMTFIVMPLCAFHYMGPYQYRGLVEGILAHMFIIGLPISTSLGMLR